MFILTTERLALRYFHLDDAPSLRWIFGDEEVMRYGDGSQTEEWITHWLQNCIENVYCQQGFGLWAVIEQSTQRLIGYCGLILFPDLDGQKEIEIGYRFARFSWGKGYATEAACAVRDYAFSQLNLSRLISLIDPDNQASIHVAEKVGMIYEKEVMLDGYTHPDHVYMIQK